MAGKFVYKFRIHMILVPWLSCSFLSGTCAVYKSDILFFCLLLNWYYWQSAEVTFLGACQGNVEPWNFCWCWAMGLLFHICFFCLPVQYIRYRKFLFAVSFTSVGAVDTFDIKSFQSVFWVSSWYKLLVLLYNKSIICERIVDE